LPRSPPVARFPPRRYKTCGTSRGSCCCPRAPTPRHGGAPTKNRRSPTRNADTRYYYYVVRRRRHHYWYRGGSRPFFIYLFLSSRCSFGTLTTNNSLIPTDKTKYAWGGSAETISLYSTFPARFVVVCSVLYEYISAYRHRTYDVSSELFITVHGFTHTYFSTCPKTVIYVR